MNWDNSAGVRFTKDGKVRIEIYNRRIVMGFCGLGS